MQALKRVDYVPPSQYLSDELQREVKHEYVGGVTYAMSGARVQHNRIAVEIVSLLSSQLRGKKCEVFNSDMKVRIQLPSHFRFYYPDALVVCDSNAPDDSFQDRPVVVVEVLSHGTRRLDQGEKKDAYLTIPSLKTYLLIEQDQPLVTAYQRGEQGFEATVYTGQDGIVPLPDIGCELKLAEIYRRIDFGAEPEDQDGVP